MPVKDWEQEAARLRAMIVCLARAVGEFERQNSASVAGEPGILQAATGLDNRSFELWRAELGKLIAGG